MICITTQTGEGDASEQKKIDCCNKQAWCFEHVGCCSVACNGRGGRLNIRPEEISPKLGGEEKLPAGRGSESQGSAWAGDGYSDCISKKRSLNKGRLTGCGSFGRGDGGER